MKHLAAITLLVLVISTPVSVFAQQQTTFTKEQTTFSKERMLEALDETVDAKEGEQRALRVALEHVVSPDEISIPIDDDMISQLESTQDKLRELLKAKNAFEENYSDLSPEEIKANEGAKLARDNYHQAWDQFADSAKSLSLLWEKFLDEALEIAQVRKGRIFDDQVRREIERIIQTYVSNDIRDPIDPIEMAYVELLRATRDPGRVDLEALDSKFLPQLITLLPELESKARRAAQETRAAIQKELKELENELQVLRQKQSALVEEIGRERQKQFKIDQRIVTWTLPVFGLVLVAILLGPASLAEDAQKLIFASSITLEMATVFLLTSTILILGVAEKISSEVLGTLIGGISGYVLGRWRRQNEEAPPSPGGK